MLEAEAVLRVAVPSRFHAIFRSVRSRRRSHEALDVHQRQTKRPHRRRVWPGDVHVPEAVLSRTRPDRLDLERALQAERVAGHPAVNAARVVVHKTDECRQPVRWTRAAVHGSDRTSRLRVVVRHGG